MASSLPVLLSNTEVPNVVGKFPMLPNSDDALGGFPKENGTAEVWLAIDGTGVNEKGGGQLLPVGSGNIPEKIFDAAPGGGSAWTEGFAGAGAGEGAGGALAGTEPKPAAGDAAVSARLACETESPLAMTSISERGLMLAVRASRRPLAIATMSLLVSLSTSSSVKSSSRSRSSENASSIQDEKPYVRQMTILSTGDASEGSAAMAAERRSWKSHMVDKWRTSVHSASDEMLVTPNLRACEGTFRPPGTSAPWTEDLDE